MAIIEVAIQYNLDPDVVERWACRDFLNRQEYMDVQAYKRDLLNG